MDEMEHSLIELRQKINLVIDQALTLESTFVEYIGQVDQQEALSARNLIHYLALRQFDIRKLQDELSALGLSSLGRAESNVMEKLLKVERLLSKLTHLPERADKFDHPFYKKKMGHLATRTELILGPEPIGRKVRIMVTLPSTAAEDYTLVKNMLAMGMDCARINCAHDYAEDWVKMARNIRQAEKELNLNCKILFDLAGPKLRTGSLEPGPRIISWQPRRDKTGSLVRPARICLLPYDHEIVLNIKADARVRCDREWLQRLEPGSTVHFNDRRGKSRRLHITEMQEPLVWADCWETAYLDEETILHYFDQSSGKNITCTPGKIPSQQISIFLRKGDLLCIHKEPILGKSTLIGPHGIMVEPAHIACPIPEIYTDTRPGETVRFDDGKMEGIIETVGSDKIYVRITHTRGNGYKLKADRGINFPDSRLNVQGLTEKDYHDLGIATRHADIVSLSFVNQPEDVHLLIEALRNLGASDLGIVLKIETQRGFKNLPLILLTAMQTRKVAIMIARGDLAVECGWVRMAEVQEEILWLCEAAHIPVIWATQVLESLAKKGLPSRAEITDAAMSQRAECVMLNKGPHILDALDTLVDILYRMQEHQQKKSARLRKLGISQFAGIESIAR
jgi:pyruvate kinase